MAVITCPHCGKATSNERGVCLLCDKLLLAKVVKPKAETAPAPVDVHQPKTVSLKLAVVIGTMVAVVAFLAGREQLRYEMRRDFEKAVSDGSKRIQESIKGMFAPKTDTK